MSAIEKHLAVVLVSHGDRGGASPNAALEAQADAVRKLTGLGVAKGMLKGEPTVEDGLAAARATGAAAIAVYPLFMAEGYFVQKVRERVLAVGLAPEPRVLAPLGHEPALPDILLREALAAAEANGLDPGQTRLLIAGHGSKLGPASATATRKAAARVAIARRFAIVATAFLEEEPFVEDALRGNPTPTVIAGFFFGDGLHAGDDIPEIIAEAGAHAVYTGAIGNNPAVAPLIAAALLSQTNKAPSP